MSLRALIAMAMLAGAVIAALRAMDASPPERRPGPALPQDARILENPAEDEERAELAGAFLSIELSGQPEPSYMRPIAPDDSDLDFEERVRASSRVAEYDPWLGRAAREIAFQGALLGESPPEAVLSFILRSAGAPEGSVAQLLLQTSDDDPRMLDEAIREAIENAPTGPGRLLVGIGEAATSDQEYGRRVVVVVARRNYDLDVTPRALALGDSWHISGLAPSGFHEATASVLYPDHRIEEIPVTIRGRRFEFEVSAGHQVGTIWMSIDGTGNDGPSKLLQLQAEVGRPVPREFAVQLPTAERFATVEEAEAYALLLLNRDRDALGLPALLLDAELSAIGRAHSEDMRDQGFFGHLSPRTGLAGDRIVTAGYRASGHGENLAFNDSIAEAQSSLLESVGHRRNIVATNTDRVGIGLARGLGPDNKVAWHLTQVFARKVQPLDPEAASQDMLDKINAARVLAGSTVLLFDEELCELAREGAREALSANIEEVPATIAPRASALTGARVAVSVHVFYQLDDLQPDETSMGPEFERLGMAFVRDDEHMHGRTVMVLISAESR